ncbi:sensor histidine kinase [Pedobacter psychrodurus]|uniref:tetratricopeptide repeat-containing sensor histidine kinase n=1 Tax=Pedobacter psychrodurus TaxID=2530456 RepID=UPI00292CD30A|nr:sensor histidine kinase [Pedobacter psychrodurus]
MNKFLPTATILLLIVVQAFARQGGQQLRWQLQKSKPDSNRLKILNDLGEYYKTRRHGKNPADRDSARIYFLNALKLSDLLKDDSGYGKGNIWMNLGEVAIDDHHIPEGKAWFMKSIALFRSKGNLENEAKAFERLGSSLRDLTNDGVNVANYYNRAIVIYQKLKNSDKVIWLSFLMAADRMYLGKPELAEKACAELITKYKNTRFRNLEMAYYLISFLSRYNGNLNKALFYALGGVRRMSLANDTSRAETLYGELAQVYQATGDTDKSIYYYKKTIYIREKINARQQFIFRTAGFVIQQLIMQNKAAEGLKYIIGLEKRHPPDSEYETAIVAQIKAYCYEALGRLNEAEKAYQVMIKGLGKDISEIGKIAHLDIAKFYVSQKKFKQAAYYSEDLNVGDALVSKDLELLRFKIDSAGGRFQSAIGHFQRYKVINDSIFTLSKTKQIQQLQIEYETEKKDKDIKILKSDSLIQQAKVQKANAMRNLTLGGVVLLVLFLVLLYNSYRFKQRKNESLNQLVTEKDHLLVEKDGLLLEKQWLLKEIHHRVKNNLQIVMGLLQRQSAYIDNHIALSAIQNSENRMRSIALIHQKLYQSESLNLISMPEYIDELIQHLKDSFDLGSRINFEKNVDALFLDVSQAVPLGLILNEAITNAIKYGYPGQTPGIVQVLLNRADNNQNILQIKDNGAGLPKAFNLEQIDSMGMNLMKGLSKQLCGSFEIVDDKGLLIKICFKTETFVATAETST